MGGDDGRLNSKPQQPPHLFLSIILVLSSVFLSAVSLSNTLSIVTRGGGVGVDKALKQISHTAHKYYYFIIIVSIGTLWLILINTSRLRHRRIVLVADCVLYPESGWDGECVFGFII